MADLMRSLLTIAATAAVIVVNGLANALPINGQQTGEISERFDVYFTPAGYVFSIWGLIYIGLIAFTVYQALPAVRGLSLIRRLAPAYWLASTANIAWLLCWHYGAFTASLAVMLVLLGALCSLYERLEAHGKPAGTAMRWCVYTPFSLYLGWVTVATIANVTVVLDFYGWTGGPVAPEVWCAAIIAVAVAIGVAVTARRRDAIFVAVLTWAFVGIWAKHADVPVVAWSAIAGAACACGLTVACVLAGGRFSRMRG